MDYFIKTTAMLCLFLVFYKIFLARETFFQSNRIFLIFGLVCSICIPLIVIPVYVEHYVYAGQFISTDSSPIVESNQGFDLNTTIWYGYLVGLIYFGIRLLSHLASLVLLIVKEEKRCVNGYFYIHSASNTNPFSFFKYIVYNKNQYNEEELQHILVHERAHAKQFHSLDVLLAHLVTVIFWFNPMAWIYKKEVEQNLEYLADAASERATNCTKSYQHLLLKTSLSTHQLRLTNNFYNSLIKKRIIMLHKNRSKNINQVKFGLILPLLLGFIFTFNTKTIAQTKVVEKIVEVQETTAATETQGTAETVEVVETIEVEEGTPALEVIKVVENTSDIEAVLITKTTDDFSSAESILSKHGVSLKIKSIKRNAANEIIAIKIQASSNSTEASFNASDEDGIAPILIEASVDGKHIRIGNAAHHDTNAFTYTNEGNHIVHDIIEIEDDGANVYIVKNEGHSDIHKVKSDDGDVIIEIKSGDKDKNVWISKDGNETIEILSDDGNDTSVFVSEFSDKKPLIIVDGEISAIDIETLDPESIESINVINGPSAIEKYGNKGEHGVIEITTKK